MIYVVIATETTNIRDLKQAMGRLPATDDWLFAGERGIWLVRSERSTASALSDSLGIGDGGLQGIVCRIEDYAGAGMVSSTCEAKLREWQASGAGDRRNPTAQ